MKKSILIAAMLSAGLLGTAQAAIVTVPFQYKFDFVGAPLVDPLGLATGSLVGGEATYDDSLSPDVNGYWLTTAFTLNLGNVTLTNTDDLFGGALVNAAPGTLTSLLFEALFTLGGSANGDYLINLNGTNLQITPSGNTSDFVATASAVPLPAALPLLMAGLGLMGFVGRRKKGQAIAA